MYGARIRQVRRCSRCKTTAPAHLIATHQLLLNLPRIPWSVCPPVCRAVEVPAGATTDLAGRPNSAASLQMVYQPESNSSVGLGKAIQWMASGSGGTYVAGVLAASMLSPGAACECGSGGWLHVSADGGPPPLSLWTTVE